jgi:hypothetical protein
MEGRLQVINTKRPFKKNKEGGFENEQESQKNLFLQLLLSRLQLQAHFQLSLHSLT